MIRKRAGLAVLAGVVLSTNLFNTSCSRKATDDSHLLFVVSVEPQRYILEKIVGDKAEIITLMPAGNNPEIFEPTVSAQKAINDSRLYFPTGFFPYENALLPAITGDTRVVNTSEGIDLIFGTHSHASSHETFLHKEDLDTLGADPHIWASVRNARTIARTMYDAVVEADSANTDFYRKRYQAYDAHLDSLDRAFAARLASAPVKSFMVWHPSLSYFARDYGLEQISVGAHSKESTLKDMRRVIDEARADSVRVFFAQKEFDNRQAQAICSGVGARTAEYSPSAYQWEESLDKVVDELTRP